MDKQMNKKQPSMNKNRPLSDDELEGASGGMLLSYSRWVCLDCGAHGEWTNNGIDEADMMAHQLINGHSSFNTETIHPANYEI